MAERDGDIYVAKQFKNLTNLRFLRIEGAHISGDFKDSIEDLKWLRWQYCPVNFEVKNFHVTELAVLELPYSEINEKWEGWSSFKMAERLKHLDLSYCGFLRNTIFLSAFKHLEVLILSWCYRLHQIDPSIGDMKALLRLDLTRCDSLTKLPAEIESLENLEILDISETGIEELPKGIGRLRKLRELRASFCSSLKRIDPSIGDMKDLLRLDLGCCKSVTELPAEIESLENLEMLDISETLIEELPKGIGRLRKLRELRASGCYNLKGELPESMCNLSSLQRLTFLNCEQLQSLPDDLPSSLTDLTVTCRSRKLPSLAHLTHLERLRVGFCKVLECIEVFPSTLSKNLECSQPTDIEESELPQSLNTPFELEFLDVWGCRSIKTVDVSQFIHLRTLEVTGCKNLVEVRGLDKLIYLESLTVKWCHSIERLLLPKYKSLKILVARECKKLAEIQGLDRLEFLESLDVSKSVSIKGLDLPKFGRLKKLEVAGCKNLAEIQGLDTLEFLESLDISRCAFIERLDLPKSGRLKILDAIDCINLAEIQGLDTLKFLESLDISGSKSLKTIPELPGTRIYRNYENKRPTSSSEDGSESTDDSDE